MARSTHHPRIRRDRLPGVGDRTEITTTDGTTVSLVEHPNGSTDLQVGSGQTARLSPADARSLGAALAGTFTVDPELLDDLSSVLGGLRIDAARVARDGHLAGRAIGELEIRARHRVTVVALLHGSLADVNPGPDTVLHGGSTVVVIGRPADVEAFLHMVGDGDGS